MYVLTHFPNYNNTLSNNGPRQYLPNKAKLCENGTISDLLIYSNKPSYLYKLSTKTNLNWAYFFLKLCNENVMTLASLFGSAHKADLLLSQHNQN